ncbi:MAG TPA: hypothetical protein VGF59_07095 [Bryobacteraceae bacterium]|jgi:hypothetical protein
MRSGWRGIVTILAAFGGVQCLTASTFTVSVGGVITSGPGPVGDVGPTVIDPLGQPHTPEGAFAGNGTLHARSLVFAAAPNALAGNLAQSTVSAREEIDDLVINGPAPTIETSLQLFYDAIFRTQIQSFAAFESSDTFSGAARDTLTITASLNCFNCGLGQLLNGVFEATVDSTDGPAVAREQQGSHTFAFDDDAHIVLLISNAGFIGENWFGVDDLKFWGVSGLFDSGRITVPTNTPLTLAMNITVSEVAAANGIADAGAGVNAFNTFGLPIGTPVFDLPPGFTANAPSIGLVNNIIPGDSAPEPMSMGLVAAGLVMVGLVAGRSHIARSRRS